MGTLTTPQSGPIYLPSTVISAVDWWISLRPDFPVSPTAPLASGKVSLTPATSGRIPSESYGRWDPDGCCWRMSQASLLTGMEEPWSDSFLSSGMTVGGALYRLPPLVPHTCVGDGGVLPTPQTTDSDKAGGPPNKRANTKRWGGVNSLGRMAVTGMWPTPTGSQARSEGMIKQMRTLVDEGKITRKEAEEYIQGSLTPPRMAPWPTPRAQDGPHGPARGSQGDLVRWPTPRCGERGLYLGAPGDRDRARFEEHVARAEGTTTGGQLFPGWVELLMGLPLDWTSLDPMSHIEYDIWVRGFGDDEGEGDTTSGMQDMRQASGEEAVRPTLGGLRNIQETEVLQSPLCEHKEDPDKTRLQLESTEAPQGSLRSLRRDSEADSPPHRPGHHELPTGEHSDPLQMVPRLLPQYGRQAWSNGSWEDGVPRVAKGVADRVNRLRAIGNGIVPSCVAEFLRRIALAGSH